MSKALDPRLAIYAEWLVSLIIAAAVTSSWRGGWLLLDALLLPQHPPWSSAASVALGSAGLVLAVAVQPSLAAWARKRTESKCTLWTADALYSYFGLWVCVAFWRGIWLAWDVLCTSKAPGTLDLALALDGSISHGCGLLVLLILGGLRNLVAPPMLIASDAAAPIFGAGVTAGIGYLNPCERLRRPPVVQSAEDWHKAVGVPYFPISTGRTDGDCHHRRASKTQKQDDV